MTGKVWLHDVEGRKLPPEAQMVRGGDDGLDVVRALWGQWRSLLGRGVRYLGTARLLPSPEGRLLG